MTTSEKFAATVTRLATATSIIRTRTEDDVRDDLHGNGSRENGTLKRVRDLERRVAELEKTLT